MNEEALYGDVQMVAEVGIDLPQPWRCQYEDAHGRCMNDRAEGSKYCVWHLAMLKQVDVSSTQGGVNKHGARIS